MSAHTSHTPGPWEMVKDGAFGHAVLGQAGGERITVADQLDEGDARLIAAAPDMLELLKLAQVRIFMLDGANAEYEAIDALLTRLGVTNHGA